MSENVNLSKLDSNAWKVRFPLSALQLEDGSEVELPVELFLVGGRIKNKFNSDRNAPKEPEAFVLEFVPINFANAFKTIFKGEEFWENLRDHKSFVTLRFPLSAVNENKMKKLEGADFRNFIFMLEDAMVRVDTQNNAVTLYVDDMSKVVAAPDGDS